MKKIVTIDRSMWTNFLTSLFTIPVANEKPFYQMYEIISVPATCTEDCELKSKIAKAITDIKTDIGDKTVYQLATFPVITGSQI
jgi:hypothetical protein